MTSTAIYPCVYEQKCQYYSTNSPGTTRPWFPSLMKSAPKFRSLKRARNTASGFDKIDGRSLPSSPSSPSPLSQCMNSKQEQRRQVFLKKVEQGRDNRKWACRGDQILQRDYVSQQRQWEEHQIRSAPEPAMVFEDESDVLAEVSLSDDIDRVDEILQQESRELEELMSLMEEFDPPTQEQERAMTDYGSDNDEDYQPSYLNAVSKPETRHTGTDRATEALLVSCQDMDMSDD